MPGVCNRALSNLPNIYEKMKVEKMEVGHIKLCKLSLTKIHKFTVTKIMITIKRIKKYYFTFTETPLIQKHSQLHKSHIDDKVSAFSVSKHHQEVNFSY